MAYASWSVVFGEQPSAAKWNILGTNDAAFNNGTGIPQAGLQMAYVATNQTTTSTSYVSLATTTDAVTVTIPSGGNLAALVSIIAYNTNSSNGQLSYMSFAVSGATTIGAGSPASGVPEYLIQNESGAANVNRSMGGASLITGLTAGSNTFSMKYKVSGGTGSWIDRRISVIPM